MDDSTKHVYVDPFDQSGQGRDLQREFLLNDTPFPQYQKQVFQSLSIPFTNNEILYYCNFEQSFSLLNKLKDETQKQVFIIGGSQIYRQFFEYCTKFYITLVENDENGDTFFPFDISIFNQECFKKNKDIRLQSKNNKIYRLIEFHK